MGVHGVLKDKAIYKRVKLEHILTKPQKYWQYLYSTDTVRASPFPQNAV